jgi:hypothetical protein
MNFENTGKGRGCNDLGSFPEGKNLSHRSRLTDVRDRAV